MKRRMKLLSAAALSLVFAGPYLYGNHISAERHAARLLAVCGYVSAMYDEAHTDQCSFRFEQWQHCRAEAGKSFDDAGLTVENWCDQDPMTEHFIETLSSEDVRAKIQAHGNPTGWWLFAFFFGLPALYHAGRLALQGLTGKRFKIVGEPCP